MGLGDFFRRLRGDQRAMPDPSSPEFQQLVQGSALPGSVEMNEDGWASAGAGSTTIGEDQQNISLSPEEIQARMQSASVSPEQTIASLRAAGVPEDQAQQAAAALAQVQQAFGGGTISMEGVTVEQGPMQTIDMTGAAGLREQMEATMRQHGVDPHSGETFDASSIPGLQEALLKVLADNGVDISQY
jgi:hypothetical protein